MKGDQHIRNAFVRAAKTLATLKCRLYRTEAMMFDVFDVFDANLERKERKIIF